MELAKEIQERIEQFGSICKEEQVEKLYLFGSAVQGRFDRRTSDIDLLVEMKQKDPVERGEALMSLWDKLESFFDSQVDLLTPSSINNPILRKKIEESKVLIYDGRREEVLV